MSLAQRIRDWGIVLGNINEPASEALCTLADEVDRAEADHKKCEQEMAEVCEQQNETICELRRALAGEKP